MKTMYLDYSNPYLQKALDLIMRDCWKDMEEDDFESDFKYFYSDHCLVNTHRNEIYVLRIDPNSPDAVYRFFYDRLNEK